MKTLLTILSLLTLSLPLLGQSSIADMLLDINTGHYEDKYADRQATRTRGYEETISSTYKSATPLDMRTRCLNLLNEQKGQYLTLKGKVASAKENEQARDEGHWKNIGGAILLFLGGTLLNQNASDPFWRDLGTGLQYGAGAGAIINGISIAANGDRYNVEVLGLYNMSYSGLKKELRKYEKLEAPTGCEEHWDMSNFKEKTPDCVIREKSITTGQQTNRSYEKEDLLYFDEEEDMELQALSAIQTLRYYCGKEVKDCATCN